LEMLVVNAKDSINANGLAMCSAFKLHLLKNTKQ